MSFLRSNVDKTLVAELEADLGRRVHVLTQAQGPEVTVLGARELLAVRSLGEWETWGWEQVIGGGWREEDKSMTIKVAGGRRLELTLDESGKFPEFFRERVQSSTVVHETHELSRGRIQIIGRRGLDGNDDLVWYTTASGGASLADPSTAAFIVQRTDELKAEWGA